MSAKRPPTHPGIRARRAAQTRPAMRPPIPREEPEPVRAPRVLGVRLDPRAEIARVLERQGVESMPLEEAAKLLPVLPEWEEFRVRRGRS